MLFKPPKLNLSVLSKDRLPPVYIERARLEVENSSLKLSGESGEEIILPVASISAIVLGPGTSVTHSAIKACAESNTPICWTGTDGIRFYSFGTSSTHDNTNARKQAMLISNEQTRLKIARQMFSFRFPDIDVTSKTISELFGMEGSRIRSLYYEMGRKYNVAWCGRNYDVQNFEVSDEINKALSIANTTLYALVTAVVCSMGYLPQLGVIHSSGSLSLVYDIADLYKAETTIPVAFESIGEKQTADRKLIIGKLKDTMEKLNIMDRIPQDLIKLFQ